LFATDCHSFTVVHLLTVITVHFITTTLKAAEQEKINLRRQLDASNSKNDALQLAEARLQAEAVQLHRKLERFAASDLATEEHEIDRERCMPRVLVGVLCLSVLMFLYLGLKLVTRASTCPHADAHAHA
jgi:uncharacterized protein YlxW (UPF0749 family)